MNFYKCLMSLLIISNFFQVQTSQNNPLNHQNTKSSKALSKAQNILTKYIKIIEEEKHHDTNSNQLNQVNTNNKNDDDTDDNQNNNNLFNDDTNDFTTTNKVFTSNNNGSDKNDDITSEMILEKQPKKEVAFFKVKPKEHKEPSTKSRSQSLTASTQSLLMSGKILDFSEQVLNEDEKVELKKIKAFHDHLPSRKTSVAAQSVTEDTFDQSVFLDSSMLIFQQPEPKEAKK